MLIEVANRSAYRSCFSTQTFEERGATCAIGRLCGYADVIVFQLGISQEAQEMQGALMWLLMGLNMQVNYEISCL